MANILHQNRQDSQTQHTQLSIETKEALKRPTFNVWEVENDQMLALLEHMFYELDLLRHFKMEPKTLWSFLCCVRSSYRQNPFHNFQHSYCVTQMMYSVISLCHLQEHLSAVDIVTLMVASLCHDLDHPGLNNVYQVNARTDLATRYENKSPLENHHCTITLHILSQPEHNIFCYSNHEDTNHIKKGVVELILATDLSYHSEILQTLQNIENLDFTNRDCVKSLMKGLIKFCDISNEVRPTEVADRWADALLEEYFMQSDREKSEGLPVTPYMNRDTVIKAEAQRTFIICLLTPLCQALSKLLPQMEVWMLQPLKEAELRYQWQIEEVKMQNL